MEENGDLVFDKGEDFDYEEGDYMEEEEGEEEEDYGFFDLENLEEEHSCEADGAPPPDQEDPNDQNDFDDLKLSEY